MKIVPGLQMEIGREDSIGVWYLSSDLFVWLVYLSAWRDWDDLYSKYIDDDRSGDDRQDLRCVGR